MDLSLGDYVAGGTFSMSGGLLYRVAPAKPIGTIAEGRSQADYFTALRASVKLGGGGYHLDRFLVEQAFEAVRATQSPWSPKRTPGAFANRTTEEARHWQQAEGRRHDAILIIRPLPNSTLQVVDVGWFDLARGVAQRARPPESRNPAICEREVEDFARRYWTGADSTTAGGTSRLEVLICGQWEVVDVLAAQ